MRPQCQATPSHLVKQKTLLGGSSLVPSLFWRLCEAGPGETCLSQPF